MLDSVVWRGADAGDRTGRRRRPNGGRTWFPGSRLHTRTAMIDGFADSLLLGLVFLAVAVALCAWPDEHSRGRYQPANGHRRGNRVAESAARMARWAIGKTLRPAAGRTGERGRPLASPLRP